MKGKSLIRFEKQTRVRANILRVSNLKRYSIYLIHISTIYDRYTNRKYW